MCDGFILIMDKKIKYMNAAIKEAEKALLIDEVPIGCVLVKNDKIIARGYNHRENKQMVFSHAEMEAIQKANKKLGNWRLVDCDIYVTVEPCIMCMGALIQSRVAHIYYGTQDLKGGAVESSINVLEAKNINHHPIVEGGILKEKCAEILSNYFQQKRKNK